MNAYKYPRTPHVPWSQSVTHDDLTLSHTQQWLGKAVVITEKMDGENTTLYRNHLHARSLDSRHHPSRTWIKQFHAQIAQNIPEGWRVCGENLFAQHSIAYHELDSYFYGFSIWNAQNLCLSWAETCEWFELMGITPVPVLYAGPWSPDVIKQLHIDTQQQEGYVIRSANAFHYDDFAQHVAKWVRAQHVQTDQHWMFAAVVPNQLRRQSS